MRTSVHKRDVANSLGHSAKLLLNGKTKRKLKRIYHKSLENIGQHPLRSIGKTKRKLKRIYKTSLANVRQHPLRSLGILTFGLGVLSGLFLFYSLKK